MVSLDLLGSEAFFLVISQLTTWVINNFDKLGRG